jgi:hypothetical protein
VTKPPQLIFVIIDGYGRSHGTASPPRRDKARQTILLERERIKREDRRRRDLVVEAAHLTASNTLKTDRPDGRRVSRAIPKAATHHFDRSLDFGVKSILRLIGELRTLPIVPSA